MLERVRGFGVVVGGLGFFGLLYLQVRSGGGRIATKVTDYEAPDPSPDAEASPWTADRLD